MMSDSTEPKRPAAAVLDRYYAGESSGHERTEVEAWLSAHPDEVRFGTALHAVTAAPVADTAELDAEAILARVRERIDGKRGSSRNHFSMGRAAGMTHRISRKAAHIGAAFAVVALVAVAYVGIERVRHDATPAQTYATRVGQRLTTRLPDGTSVTLAPQSVLRVAAGFGRARREVEIVGQAYFSVRASSSAPFVVRSGDVMTRVLGTTFMVRRYTTDGEVVVAVESGKVETERVGADRGRPLMLTHNMVARIADSTIVLTNGVDLREYMEWREGRLMFTGVTAAEIAKVLGQWYGLEFKFADTAMAKRSLSGAFDDRDPRQEVLQNLQIMLGARMTFTGNVVTLAPKTAVAAPLRRHDVREEQSSLPTEVGR